MKLSICSWLAASPSANVLLFLNRTEFDLCSRVQFEIDEQFGAGRVVFAGKIRADDSGVPYINEWFIEGMRQKTSRYVCFINSDILISARWFSCARQIFKVMGYDRNVLLIGQRIDFVLIDSEYDKLRFTQNSLLVDIDSMVQRSPHSNYCVDGIDSFTFNVNLPPFNAAMIPPFLMGRPVWDNWLIGWCNQISDTVTFNLDPPIYHINHVNHTNDPKDPKVIFNRELWKANGNYYGTNINTKWRVINRRIVARRDGSVRYILDR
jgi:hypothetical protein